MKNLDNQVTEAQLRTNLHEAFVSGDEGNIADAMLALSEYIQSGLLEEARNAARGEANDYAAMTARGIQPLTAAETKYYNEVISNRGFVGVEALVPETVINRVFEDLEAENPLLNHIDFVPVGAATKWIYRNGKINSAWWGKLCSEIKEVLDEGFNTIDLGLFKLSAFMPVCNAMLDLGPEWLDRYVRTVLAEGMTIALEEGIVAGTGKEMPAGMIMNLETFNSTNGYAIKTAKKLKDLTPATLGKEIMGPLTKGGTKVIAENGANGILLIVNPLDYWEKIFPATTPYVDAQGLYRFQVTPLPVTFVQSVAMPKNRMSAGKGADYFMGVGSERKFEVLKELRAIQDETVYLTKMYGNGRPKENDSFLFFDISELKAFGVTEPPAPATL
jgi:hypothetical protein